MENQEITGTFDEMTNWMKESGCNQEKINAFKQALNENIYKEGRIASNCKRSVSGRCNGDNNDSCLEYTITCCSKDENGVTICASTTVCRC